MNRQEKAQAIAERLGDKNYSIPLLLSMIVIADCLLKLEKKGILEVAYGVSERGQNIAALCSEFEWQPTDKEIQFYCETQMEGITAEEREKVFTIIKALFLKKIEV